jgi:hypothetical protein
MIRWILFFIAIALGVTAGLYYGWVMNPVEYMDTSPDTLRIDYKTDYVLMVAEAYQAEKDLGVAASRLNLLGTVPPTEVVARAILFASTIQPPYPQTDLALMQTLARDLQSWKPTQGVPSK